MSSRRLTPCTNPQPGSEPPGLRLIWVFSPPRRHFVALKGQAWGVKGGSGSCWLRSPSSCGPVPGLASPSLWLWRKEGPQSQSGQGGRLSIGVVGGVGSWNAAPLALPGSQPPSGFHLKLGLDPLLCLLTNWGRKRVGSGVPAAYRMPGPACAQWASLHASPSSGLAPAWEM